MFKAAYDCITSAGISWPSYVGICTDRAEALTRHKKGFQAYVRQVAPDVNFIHCIIRRKASTSRDLQPQSHNVLQEAVNVVNFVRARPLNGRLFAALCEEIQAAHRSLLLHLKVRWLSREEVLKRLVDLKEGRKVFTRL
jgi:hypothetical protein